MRPVRIPARFRPLHRRSATLTLVIILCTLEAAAAPREGTAGLQITVRSHEKAVVDGSFTVDF